MDKFITIKNVRDLDVSVYIPNICYILDKGDERVIYMGKELNIETYCSLEDLLSAIEERCSRPNIQS